MILNSVPKRISNLIFVHGAFPPSSLSLSLFLLLPLLPYFALLNLSRDLQLRDRINSLRCFSRRGILMYFNTPARRVIYTVARTSKHAITTDDCEIRSERNARRVSHSSGHTEIFRMRRYK